MEGQSAAVRGERRGDVVRRSVHEGAKGAVIDIDGHDVPVEGTRSGRLAEEHG